MNITDANGEMVILTRESYDSLNKRMYQLGAERIIALDKEWAERRRRFTSVPLSEKLIKSIMSERERATSMLTELAYIENGLPDNPDAQFFCADARDQCVRYIAFADAVLSQAQRNFDGGAVA